MPKHLSLLLLMGVVPLAACSRMPSASDMVGTWKCASNQTPGPGYTFTIFETFTINQGGTYVGQSTVVVVSDPGQEPLTLLSRAGGTWELAGDVLRSHVRWTKFVSSSSGIVSQEAGQKGQDDALKKKSTYELRILPIGRGRFRFIPLNVEKGGFAVVSVCAHT